MIHRTTMLCTRVPIEVGISIKLLKSRRTEVCSRTQTHTSMIIGFSLVQISLVTINRITLFL